MKKGAVDGEPSFTWADSFSEYRVHSNEDERIAEAFATLVLPRLAHAADMHWLDIGCGDCAKTATHARLLAKVCTRPTATLVDQHLRDLLTAATEHIASIRQVLGDVRLVASDLASTRTMFEDCDRSARLVTAIHSIHTRSASDALMTSIRTRMNARSSTMFFVVSESTQSDIYRIRTGLQHRGLTVPRPFTDDLVEFGCRIGAHVTQHSITRQYCRFDRTRVMENPNYWLLPFLLGETAESYSARQPTTRRKIEEVVREFINELDSDHLSTPDDAVTVEVPD